MRRPVNPHSVLRAAWLVVLAACFVLLPLYGCATHADPPPEITVVARIADYRPAWQPIFKGVDLAQGRKAAPDPVALYAARVDLKAPDVAFMVEAEEDSPRHFVPSWCC